MKRLLRQLIILPLLIWVACEDEKLSNSDDDTIYEYESHSNNRVSSLLMSESDYSDWVNNDGFSDGSTRLPLVQDVYNKFSDKYDFIFFVLNEPTKLQTHINNMEDVDDDSKVSNMMLILDLGSLNLFTVVFPIYLIYFSR